jgi:hypothetical protein
VAYLQAPFDLRERGSEFWGAVTGSADLDPAGLILLGEACRIIDRLDRLSAALNGKGRDWLKLMDEIEITASRDGSGSKISVKVAVDGLLSEARQQQLALKTVVAQLGLAKATERVSGEKSALAAWLESRSG